MRRFDVAVIGCGMIGSAAARHLAEAGRRVALIGADEPGADGPGPGADHDRLFSSHDDEARITRISATDPVWSELAARSVGRYDDIAVRSGIRFHQPTGLIQATTRTSEAIDAAVERGGDARAVDADWIRRSTGIEMPQGTGTDFLYEAGSAGVINPRKLVAAQLRLAIAAGAEVATGPALGIDRSASGFVVHTGDAGRMNADRVVLATGPYGASVAGIGVAVERRLRTVVHIEVDPVTALPCLILERPAEPTLERLYWTAPVRYPDGRTMLKIGGSAVGPHIAADAEAIADWFLRGGSTDEAAVLVAAARALLPTATIISTDHKPCVMTHTPNDHPFIGHLEHDLVVAVGGNGSAAKSSDEIGRLAADLAITGSWQDCVLDPTDFTPQLLR